MNKSLPESLVISIKSLCQHPYRIFFLFGMIGLFLGLSVWILSGFVEGFYFGRMHAQYMIGIFLINFVIGFLMTAIPRMSGQEVASTKETLLQLIPMLSAAIWGIFEDKEIYFFWSLVVAMLVLFAFCIKRIRNCQHQVPDVFPMVILSLFSGLLGAMLIILGYRDLGSRLFYLNFVLGLCVGIGAKVIPLILRLKVAIPTQYRKGEFWMVGLLLTAACFVESFGSERMGSALRALIITMFFFRYWKIHHWDRGNGGEFYSSAAWGIRISSLSMLLGAWGLWFFPYYRLEALHVLYVSGFGLLTLMVASRVILAHGQHDLRGELKNAFINIPIILIILATTTRVMAIFIEGGYLRHLAYAAFLVLLACFLWGHYFLPKLLKSGGE